MSARYTVAEKNMMDTTQAGLEQYLIDCISLYKVCVNGFFVMCHSKRINTLNNAK